MSTAPPLDWIREIDAALVALDEKPQFGVPVPFDWGKFESGLRDLLQKPLKIEQKASEWVASNQLFKGLGENLLTLPIEWSPLHTPAFFVLEQRTLKNLISELFNSNQSASYFYDSHLAEGFYHYLVAEILYLIENQHFASPLTPRIGAYDGEMHQVIGEESCFATDLCLSINGKNFWGRMLLSESFRAEWKTYFAHQSPAPINEEMKRKITVDISLEIAHTQLRLEEWKTVKDGDFVILDHCSYDPIEHNGAVDLTLNRKPLFRGRIKEGGIKITNYPVYEEVRDSMDDEPVRRDFEKDHEDLDSDFDEDEDSEFDEDLFLDLEEDEEPAPLKEKKTSLKEKPTPAEESLKISPEELPVHLTIEVGRMRMTVGELLALAPGNLIDLHVAPEQGVDLVVNGKKVGRGELIRMGDVLGVRILSI